MKLSEFILSNMEPILVDWEDFARSIWPGGEVSPATLRDHAEDMLRAVALDMESDQTAYQEGKKSKGKGEGGKISLGIDAASGDHATSRAASGFDLQALVAEYRALRASVIRLWEKSKPAPQPHEIGELVRFNEAIDQLLAESVHKYATRLDQSREIFLGILGHDLRNPLHAISMLSTVLVESGKVDSTSHLIASKIAKSVAAMDMMVRDLLDFTGTRLGAAMTLAPAPMDLKSLCREVLDEMEAIHPSKIFEFDCEGDTDGEWDSSRLRQLISNLLGNAVHHGFPATPIKLSIRSMGETVLLSVSNQGPTIPPESHSLIFEPLRQAPTDLSKQRGSIGLGLYIAREVADAHGGSIRVTSTDEETRFMVTLPK